MKKVRNTIKRQICLLIALSMMIGGAGNISVTAHAMEQMESDENTLLYSNEESAKELLLLSNEERKEESISENKVQETVLFDSSNIEEEELQDELKIEEKKDSQINDSQISIEEKEKSEPEQNEETEDESEEWKETKDESEIEEESPDEIEKEEIHENEDQKEEKEDEFILEEEEVLGDKEEEENAERTPLEEEENSKEEESFENSLPEDEVKAEDSISENDIDKEEENTLLNQPEELLEEVIESHTIQILVDKDRVELFARIDAQTIELTEMEEGFSYTASKDEQLVVTVKAKDNFKISSAVTRVEGIKDKKEKVSSTEAVLSVKATADTITTIETEALYKGILKKDGEEIKLTGKVYFLDAGVSYTAEVLHGLFAIDLEDVRLENKKGEDTVAVKQGNNQVNLMISSADAGNTAIKMKLITTDGKEIIYPISVRPILQSITVKGVSKGVLKQTVDTRKEYKLTIKPATADLNSIYLVTEGEIEAKLTKDILEITTPAEVSFSGGTIHFYKKEPGAAEDRKIEGASFVVEAASPTTFLNAKVTAKVVETTDVSVKLSLTVPKTLETPVKGIQFYEITIVPDNTLVIPDSIKNAVSTPVYIKRTGLSQEETVLVNTAEMGKGENWKYTIHVRLIQLKETKELDEITGEDVKKAYQSNSVKLTAATQKPAYETKLSIKKAVTTIYTGQENITIGTPNFSKTTTFRNITEIDDITEHITEEEQLNVEYVNGVLAASIPLGSKVAIGKHTISVSAQAPEGSKAAVASIDVMVVRGIEDIQVVPEGNTIFKQYNKPATLNVNHYYNTTVMGNLPEPKVKKVTYEVVDGNQNEILHTSPLYKMITVKNGKITIDKNLIVTLKPEENTFCVKVIAADYKGNAVSAYSEPIRIKTTTSRLGQAVLLEKELDDKGNYKVISRGNETLKIEEFHLARIAVVYAGVPVKESYAPQELIDTAELSFSSSNKAIQIGPKGDLFTEQVVKNISITAKSKDGSNQTVTLSKLTIDYTNPLALGVNISRGTYDYMGQNPVFYTIGSPDSRQVSYKASNNEIFQLEVMKKDENDNWCPISSDECMNYTLSLKGGKQLSGENNVYLITATAAQTVITLTDKANSNLQTVYTLNNEAALSKDLTSLKVTALDSLIGGNYSSVQTINFEVLAGGDYDYSEKYAEIRVDPSSMQKNRQAYEGLLSATNDIDGYHSLNIETIDEYSEEGELVSTYQKVGFSITINQSVDLNNYVFNISLGNVVDGDFIADTKTTALTLKAIEMKKQNLTFKPTTSYCISTADNHPITLVGDLNKEEASYQFTGVHNVISEGEVNEFTKYFEFHPKQGKTAAKITLKKGLLAADLLKEEGKKHCSAFVDYVVFDKNGAVYQKDSVKIDITVQKEPTGSMKRNNLPILTDNKPEMFLPFLPTVGGEVIKPVGVYIARGNFVWDKAGNRLITGVVPSDAKRGEELELYWLPESSCFAELVEEYENQGKDREYNNLLENYGIHVREKVQFKSLSDFADRISGATSLIKINGISITRKNFVRDTITDPGYYYLPITYTKKAAVDITSVKFCELIEPDETGEALDFISVEINADSIYIRIPKDEIVSFMNLYKEENRKELQKVKVVIHYKAGQLEKEESSTISFRLTRTNMEFNKVKSMIEKSMISFLKVSWSGSEQSTIDKLTAQISKRFERYTRDDSDAAISFTIVNGSFTEPTRLTDGAVNINVELMNTLTQEKTEYPLTVKINKLGAWPEDIAAELDQFMQEYQKEEAKKVYNHTIAEEIAEDLKKQDFITKHGHFKVDVSNLTKKRATEVEMGECRVRVRILDTTGKGSTYEKYYSWPIFMLDTVEEVRDLILQNLEEKSANNRTNQSVVAEWIEGVVLNPDISWRWDYYHKELSTHEKEGKITGVLELKNPRSVVEPKTCLFTFEVPLEKMSSPEIVRQALSEVVGQDALPDYWFYEDIYKEDGSIDRIWKSSKEIAEIILKKAEETLEYLGEMYYVEYGKDSKKKDLFTYSLPTYKTDRTISYTLNIVNEFTKEVAATLEVNQFSLEMAQGDTQTMDQWKKDILALVEEGNKNGRFSNEYTVGDLYLLLEEALTSSNYYYCVNTKETESGTQEEFYLKEATLNTTGSISTVIILNDNNTDKKVTLSLSLKIPELSQTMSEAEGAAKEARDALSSENMISNITTANSILSKILSVLKSSKYQVSWSNEKPFIKKEATKEEAGTIEGELILKNLRKEEGEEESLVIPIHYTITKLKTEEEAITSVEDVITGLKVLELAKKGDADSVKQRILEEAGEVIRYDDFKITYKRENSMDLFTYKASSYKEDGYVSYTLLLTTKSNTLIKEIIVPRTVIPVDPSKQTRSHLNTDIKNLYQDLFYNKVISNDTTAEELLQAAYTVLVNPSFELFLWNEEEYGRNGTIARLNGREMTKTEATNIRKGRITICFVLKETANGKNGYSLLTQYVEIPMVK